MLLGFKTRSAYEEIIAGLRNQIHALQSGAAYQEMEAKLKSALHTINRLEKQIESTKRQCEKYISNMADKWIDAMETVRQETEKTLAQKDAELQKMAIAVQRAEEKCKAEHDEKVEALKLYKAEQAAHQDTKDKLAALQAKLSRDYTNSAKSSSASPNHPHIPNGRHPTGKKRGAQLKHDFHGRKRMEPTNTVKLTPPAEFLDTTKYKPTGHTRTKQLICLRIAVEATDYVADEYRNLETGSVVHAPFPEGLKDDVTYDSSVKAAAYLLNHHCHASIDKTISFLREVSHGAIHLSKGFVNGLGKEFSTMTKEERDQLFLSLSIAPVLHVDFTFSRCDGKTATAAVTCTENTVLYQSRESKGDKGVKDTPAEINPNTIVSDHEASLVKLGSRHQECNGHVIRYLIGSEQNETNLDWASKMEEVIQNAIHYRNSLAKDEPLDPEKVKAFEAQFMKIAEDGMKEYENEPPTDYYRDGFNLCKRLSEKPEDYLLFLHDKDVPPTNNLAERMARDYKRASAASMGYRSATAHSFFCDGLSMIKTHLLRGDNLFDYVCDCFRGNAMHYCTSDENDAHPQSLG